MKSPFSLVKSQFSPFSLGENHHLPEGNQFIAVLRGLNPQRLLCDRNGLVAHRLRGRRGRRSCRALEAPARLLNFGTQLIREDGQGLQLLLWFVGPIFGGWGTMRSLEWGIITKYLVGGWPTEKWWSQLGWWHSQLFLESHIPNDPNHQPDYDVDVCWKITTSVKKNQTKQRSLLWKL